MRDQNVGGAVEIACRARIEAARRSLLGLSVIAALSDDRLCAGRDVCSLEKRKVAGE